jgi:electron transport complex protein RnfD
MLVMGFYASFNLDFMLAHALSGTLFFAATYMATDYSSGCLTPGGKTVFAIGAGILTAFFRIVFTYPGGVGFAILIMNFLAPHIDQWLMPRIYGHKERPKVRFNRQGRA